MAIEDFNLLALVNRMEMDALHGLDVAGAVVSVSPKEALRLCREVRMLHGGVIAQIEAPPPEDPQLPKYMDSAANRVAHEFEDQILKATGGKRS